MPNLIKNLIRRFGNSAVASKSYRYLSRQVTLDLAHVEGGKLLVFSSATNMDVNSEVLLMFSHFLQDELLSNVLIIDATLRNSGLTKLLALKDQAGLIDVLSNSGEFCNPESVCHPLRENVSFIAAGVVPKRNLPYTSEVQIKELLDDFRQKFDYVILQQDNICLDTRYLPYAKLADLVLLHLHERNTPLSEFDEISDVLRDHQITNVKYVLSEP